MTDNKRSFHFDKVLLDNISFCHDEAKSMLNKDLSQAADDFGTLLHHAAFHSNSVIVRYLLELGSDVDSQESESSKTPLVLAVETDSSEVIKILLAAKANIDLESADGKSALRMVFDTNYFDEDVLQAFFARLLDENLTSEQMAERLIKADCPLYNVVLFLRDVEVVELMLNRGVDVNSEGFDHKTALQAAAELEDVPMATMLIEREGDVNAYNEDGTNVVLVAASKGNSELLNLLLQRAADPDAKDYDSKHTPLFEVFVNVRAETEQKYYESAVLLLRHGAHPRNASTSFLTMLDHAVINGSFKLANLLISHLAWMETMFGDAVGTAQTELYVQSIMRCNFEVVRLTLPRFEEYRRRCKQVLQIPFGEGKYRLLDLYKCPHLKMRICMRNESRQVELSSIFVEHRLSDDFPYYYELLSERVARIVEMVKVEKIAISKLCEIFTECYQEPRVEFEIIAEKVLSYMNEYNLDYMFGEKETSSEST